MDISLFVGLPKWDAMQLAVMHGRRLRVVRTDGIPHVCTRDHDVTRINITVEKDRVTKATLG